jgi:hypothetical protein
MKFISIRKIIPIAVVIVFIISCKKEHVPTCNGTNPKYNSEIKSIIDSNCTSSNCHSNYSSYSGLQSILSNGKFKSEVLDKQSMPKNGNLSDTELDKIKCWVDNGYPEN